MIRLWDSKEILHTLSNYFALSTRDFAPQLMKNTMACEAWSSGRTRFSYLPPFFFFYLRGFLVCMVSFLFAWFLFYFRGFLFVCVFFCSSLVAIAPSKSSHTKDENLHIFTVLDFSKVVG